MILSPDTTVISQFLLSLNIYRQILKQLTSSYIVYALCLPVIAVTMTLCFCVVLIPSTDIGYAVQYTETLILALILQVHLTC